MRVRFAFALSLLLASSRSLADSELHFGAYQVKKGHYAGQVVGRVVLTGPTPQVEPVKHSHDQTVCGDSNADDSLMVDVQGGVANAIVIVDAPSGNPPVASKDATIDQVGCLYHPRVQALPLGSTLTAINSDPLLHTVHAWNGDLSVFNKAEPLKGDHKAVELKKPGLLIIKCDLHNWMKAFVAVVPHPYFAITGADGRFHIDSLPPGEYPMQVWHERLGVLEARATVPEKGPVQLDFTSPALP